MSLLPAKPLAFCLYQLPIAFAAQCVKVLITSADILGRGRRMDLNVSHVLFVCICVVAGVLSYFVSFFSAAASLSATERQFPPGAFPSGGQLDADHFGPNGTTTV